MERKIIITEDGSPTVSVPEMNVTYHSIHGAIQESLHVFIEAGLYRLDRPDPLNIFEMGFGTGLNTLLTLIEAEKLQQPIHYTTIELYPLNNEELNSLNYCQLLNRPDLQSFFDELHFCIWEKEIAITPFFSLNKIKSNLINFSTHQLFNLIYFDAFAPTAQPELWTREVFEKLYIMMSPGGILVTYCSKSVIRKAMLAAGFRVEKIPGPPGKREMVRANK